jgi:hypothetical protein
VSGEQRASGRRPTILPPERVEALSPDEVEEIEPGLADLVVSVDRLALANQTLAIQVRDHMADVDLKFGAIHEDIALLRHSLFGDGGVAPRIAEVEKRTLPQRAAHVTAVGAKYGVYISFGVLVLNGLARRFPELQQFADLLRGLSP